MANRGAKPKALQLGKVGRVKGYQLQWGRGVPKVGSCVTKWGAGWQALGWSL